MSMGNPMKKILVVEDEYLVRIGICLLCDWEKHGYVVIGNASNGIEALEIIKKNKPHIILTDLMMDDMDGFELIKECQRLYPEIALVVLSNYNDFDNVKKAMQLGARDYILKLTIKPQELLETLDLIKIDTSANSLIDPSKVLLNNLSPIWSRMLRIAIEASYESEEEFKKQLKDVGIVIDWGNPFYILQIIVDDYLEKVRSDEISEPQLLLSTMEHIVQEAFLNIGNPINVIIHEKGRIAVLVSAGSMDYTVLNEQLLAAYKIIRENAARFLDIGVSAYLSSECNDLEDLSVFMKDADFSLYSTLWGVSGQFLTAESSPRESIRRTVAYIADNLNSNLDLATLSNVAAMSECYFSHIFKKEKGIGLKDYVNQQRIRKAKQLLGESSMKISSVALEVGIINANYFSALFKKMTNQTPNEYRNSKKPNFDEK